jgi:predicted RNA binding protein YcfA (HicA-like mRNA interferase family)
MPPLGPIKRRDFIRHLRSLGFDGPHVGGKHQYMIRDAIKVAIPNPHQKEISTGLLIRVLRQAGIDRDEWENS